MKTRIETKWTVRVLAAILLGLPLISVADPISVIYDIGTYSEGNFSASWLHNASGCADMGPSGSVLYMCGGPIVPIEGTISGDLDGGILEILGGVLTIDDTDYNVLGGILGPFAALAPGLTWSLIIDGYGEFSFENIDMGAGLPNFFDGDEFVLWGQNQDAYNCQGGDCESRGMDLYGRKRVSVPEPSTLTLFGIGLIGLGLSRRRRNA